MLAGIVPSRPAWDYRATGHLVRAPVHRCAREPHIGRWYRGVLPVPWALTDDARMTDSLGRRLLLRFQRSGASDADVEPRETPTPLPPLVDFVAYAEDRILSGRVRLAAERLTDMLNDHDEYVLRDVLVERLLDASAIEVAEVVVRRDDLLVVHAAGPRGSQARRHRTRQHPLAIQLGPYHVRGYLHALPGSDPLLAIRRRKAMVPLTDARIEWAVGADHHRRRVGALLINREQLDWAVPATGDEVDMPDLPLSTDTGPLVKDFTGQLIFEPMDPALS